MTARDNSVTQLVSSNTTTNTTVNGSAYDLNVWSQVKLTGSTMQQENGRNVYYNTGTATSNTTNTYMTTTTETVSGSYTTSADNVVSTAPIFFMRSIEIKFKGTTFRPFTRLYPFFDGVSIAGVCTPTGGSLGGPLITNRHGEIEGTFHVPNTEDFKFETGKSTFRLSDNEEDSRDADETVTWGETTFESGGTLETRQITYTTHYYSYEVETSSFSTATSTSTNQVTVVVHRDPIAQSFGVPGEGGNFITKVGIRFATKSVDLPVTLQIRPVENGVPTLTRLVGGEVTLNPDAVTISADATAVTFFTFDNPLYLEPDKPYAIVLLADTQDYNAYLAEMGELVIGHDVAIAKQPHLGVFFSSSNGTTWTPSQMQDLCFEVHAAKFDTSKTGVVEFGNKDVEFLPTTFNAIKTVSGSDTLTLFMRDHALKAGDSFVISGAVGGNDIEAILLNGTQTVISVVDVDRVTFSVGVNANTTGTIGGNNIKVKANLNFTSLHTYVSQHVFPDTEIAYEISYVDQNNRNVITYDPINVNRTQNMNFSGVVRGVDDYRIKAILKSKKENLSPVLDLTNVLSVLVQNRINNNVDDPLYCYVTKDIIFDTPSTSSRMYLGALVPFSSTIKLYYKLFRTSANELIADDWVELDPTSPVVSDETRAIEYTYLLENVGSFVGYKIMLKMLGDDPTKCPTLIDFRTIALA